MTDFGTLLRVFRLRSTDPVSGRPLSQQRLGGLLREELGVGFSGAAVSDWERGKSKLHADDRLTRLGLLRILHERGGIKEGHWESAWYTARCGADWQSAPRRTPDMLVYHGKSQRAIKDPLEANKLPEAGNYRALNSTETQRVFPEEPVETDANDPSPSHLSQKAPVFRTASAGVFMVLVSLTLLAGGMARRYKNKLQPPDF